MSTTPAGPEGRVVRAVSVLEVADVGVWAELDAIVPLGPYVEAELSPTRRVVRPSFEREVRPKLPLLVRYARRDAAAEAAAREHVDHLVDAQRIDARRVLRAALRHALEGLVIGRMSWDPDADAGAVRALVGAGLLVPYSPDEPPYVGRYRLHPDLPPPAPHPYDLTDALMDETDDLVNDAPIGPMALLHDVASLAAAIEHVSPKLTHQGTVAVADGKRIGRQLAEAALIADGKLDAHPRWGRALRALTALHAVTPDPATRALHLDLGLEALLRGDDVEATDRLVHRLVDVDLHVVVPAVREALRQAGTGAVDEVVFIDLLREQHRDLLVPSWWRDGQAVYPLVGAERPRPYDDDGFDVVEARMIRAALGRMARFGLLRRGEGVFAGTADGRHWAAAPAAALHRRPPLWVTGDLELIVPPDALTPWERFQVERLGRCIQRDTADRYRLERDKLVTWMSTHDVQDAIDLLHRRCPGVPASVDDTLRAWARAAERAVLWRGVVVG